MTQETALSILKTGGNVFLTGEPGAGKTYVLNQYLDWLAACNVPVAITASTGIAATHVGGTTIHSWSGIGARDTLTQFDLDRIGSNEKTVKRIKKAKVLVIDEISMLGGKLLDGVDQIARSVRRSGEPFGGLQVVVVGDFFQLPPITKFGEPVHFAFLSHAWQRAKFLTCYITEQHRGEDPLLLSLLSSIRSNTVEEEHYTLLGEQKDIGYENIVPTRLFTHNKDVDTLNATELSSLSTEARTYAMDARGGKLLVEGLKKNCLSPEKLVLKKEAMVMCTKNNFEVGYVNGTLGRVVDFDSEDSFPIIETSDARELKITPQSWSVEEDGKTLAEVSQVPLRLAWAITVHKSQGMTLDAAEMDLTHAFAYGQGYVALSRVRSLVGMRVMGINANALSVDPRVVHADERFKTESEDAEDAFLEMDEEELGTMHEQFVTASGGTYTEDVGQGAREKRKEEKKESTYQITKKMIEEGFSPEVIAKKRGMTLSTIWNHIERLLTDGAIGKTELTTLTKDIPEFTAIYRSISVAIEEVGEEKLKPIYEHLNGEYDYDTIRLVRIVYQHS